MIPSTGGPIVVTVNNHGFQTGDQVFIRNVQGNTAANGAFTITVVDANQFSLNGSTSNGKVQASSCDSGCR